MPTIYNNFSLTPLPFQGNMLETINEVAWFEFEWHAASASNGREAFEQHSQCDACLQTCQRSTQTEMNAMTEAQMTIGAASDIKDLSMRELPLIKLLLSSR
ncbi:hypothetical protein KSF_089680 [Reticulibacter mediterranei]|uniref:Uncharacterized protein n=1 Tax=Reticulibacter mediterranei TaxID=2778369 RepID=A0A8J3N7W9_9CHLR|nr:hypothetical protein KSF_089680 [Reticulibacter mediterranei]